MGKYGTKALNYKVILALILVNFIYATESVASKLASQNEYLSFAFLRYLGIVLIILATYAMLWQQMLKRVELTTAYMFKGTSLVFILVLSHLIFGEFISTNNILGSLVIIIGIILHATE